MPPLVSFAVFAFLSFHLLRALATGRWVVRWGLIDRVDHPAVFAVYTLLMLAAVVGCAALFGADWPGLFTLRGRDWLAFAAGPGLTP